uniref:Uncharacterized mitochondrial protein AtMg00810-like n=1 Tax=Tanacetum cinerariifolium TaxID=118510 RepID=A0A699KHQ2_TANCI|nr:uncharacterized mitochondrial protein AtMg00810-like [Tanacetum cinerariifolium]
MHKDDILLVQVYVDDIIFGSTKKELCNAFEKKMHEKFQMSSMGELTFFLGLQVKQKQDGIFINQDKYIAEILKKYEFSEVKNASTPMETQKPLLKDEDREEVDVHITFNFSSDHEDNDEMADKNNLNTTIQVSPNTTTRIHKDHPLDQVIGDLHSTTQTRNMSKNLKEHGFVTTIHQRTNYKDLENYLFACFLSQEEPKKVIHALKDPS